MPEIAKDYQSIAAAKKKQLQSKIPKVWLLPMGNYRGISNLLNVPLTCGILDDVDCSITSNYDATGLLEQLRSVSGQLSKSLLPSAREQPLLNSLFVTQCFTSPY